MHYLSGAVMFPPEPSCQLNREPERGPFNFVQTLDRDCAPHFLPPETLSFVKSLFVDPSLRRLLTPIAHNGYDIRLSELFSPIRIGPQDYKDKVGDDPTKHFNDEELKERDRRGNAVNGQVCREAGWGSKHGRTTTNALTSNNNMFNSRWVVKIIHFILSFHCISLLGFHP